MKSVLIAALIGPGGYTAKPIMDAFLNNGFTDVRVFDYQLNRFSIGKDLMQRKLIHEATQMKPDIIWCQIQGSDIIDLETWQALQRIAFVVNFTFDIRTNEQTQWLYNLVPHIGLVCFSNLEDVEECNRRGYKNVMCLQSSADPDVYKPKEGVKRKGVVFIGNNFCNTNMEFPLSKERAAMVEFLQKEFPDDFKVYGNNWDGSKLIGQKEEVEIYQSAAIVINHNNFNHTSYTSDRLWRAMFCGALCLTKYFKGIEKLLLVGVEIDVWFKIDELKEKVSYYLDHADVTEQMGYRGMLSAKREHTWSSRVKEMMTFIENLKPTIEDNRDGCTKHGAHVIDGKIPEPLDQHLDGRTCDCGRLLWKWTECECGNKEYQLRAKENI
jgi:spore maturation protein CgeB